MSLALLAVLVAALLSVPYHTKGLYFLQTHWPVLISHAWYLLLIVPIFGALYFLRWLYRSAIWQIKYYARRSARARRGPPQYVPYTVDTVSDELKRLHESFESGLSRPLSWRKEQLMCLYDMFKEHREDLLMALKQDLGKHPAEGMYMECLQILREIEETVWEIDDWAKPQTHPSTAAMLASGIFSISTKQDPLGIVLVIGTWNYPLMLSMMPLIGSIMGGNCTILKLPRISKHTSALLASLLPKYMDMRCLTVEWEGGRQVIGELIRPRNPTKEAALDMIFFTGAVETGKVIYEAAAKNMVKCILELGGKNPAIVDCRMNPYEVSRRLTWGKWTNAGQTCIAPDYVILVGEDEEKRREVADKLVSGFRSQMKKMWGDDPKKSSGFGRIINKETAKHFQEKIAEVRPHVVIGGEVDIENRYVAPTVVLDPPLESLIMTEEIFGPILPIVQVDTVENALRLSKSRDKTPLSFYVFSEDPKFYNKALDNSRSGAAGVNDALFHCSTSSVPFGGVGTSGLGSYHGKKSFESFTHQRTYFHAFTSLSPLDYFRFSPFPLSGLAEFAMRWYPVK